MSLSNASIVRLTHSAPLQAARGMIRRDKLLAETCHIQQIPAPTFAEEKRAAYVMERFRALGLSQVEQDELYNVWGWLPLAGKPQACVLLICAHTDTVFSADSDLRLRQEGERLYGAGIGDNSLGVAALLTLAELFISHPLPRDCSLCFLANTREEGLGDLGGIKAFLDGLPTPPNAAIVIEGMALGRIYHAGIAVKRLKITFQTQGGHSWLHFGNPSAIHSLFQFGAALDQLKLSQNPRATYNVGLVEGGSSVNTIAAHAACWLDLRSEASHVLVELEAQVRHLAQRQQSKDVHVHFEVVGERPAGAISAEHPLVRLAQNAHQSIQMNAELESGSTDANALLARGIPTVCVGVSYGGNAHTHDEYIECGPLEDGLWQLLLLTTAASNAVVTW